MPAAAPTIPAVRLPASGAQPSKELVLVAVLASIGFFHHLLNGPAHPDFPVAPGEPVLDQEQVAVRIAFRPLLQARLKGLGMPWPGLWLGDTQGVEDAAILQQHLEGMQAAAAAATAEAAAAAEVATARARVERAEAKLEDIESGEGKDEGQGTIAQAKRGADETAEVLRGLVAHLEALGVK